MEEIQSDRQLDGEDNGATIRLHSSVVKDNIYKIHITDKGW